MLKVFVLAVFAVAVLIVVTLFHGARRWEALSRSLKVRLEAARLPAYEAAYESQELSGLPAPVQRYFRAVLQEGQPVVRAVDVEHTGTFNTSETGEDWKPFASKQRIITSRPGFDWEARISMMPGLSARVHDAYIAGEGILHASLLGLISLADQRGTTELAQGELLRFLAEAAWYPTALLPSQGVTWEAIDDSSARVILEDREVTVTMVFRFDDDGLIESEHAEARGRNIGGGLVPTQWEGRWSRYELREGMRIPLEGEVAWILPEGRRPYWRGQIRSIRYEFAESPRGTHPQGDSRLV